MLVGLSGVDIILALQPIWAFILAGLALMTDWAVTLADWSAMLVKLAGWASSLL